MFAPRYENVRCTRNETNTCIEFIYRDDDDIPEKIVMFVDKDQVVSNTDSAELLEAVFYEATGHRVFLHRKYFNLDFRYFFRISDKS